MYWAGDFENNTARACWKEHTISRLSMYRVFLIGFTLIFGPFVYFNIQKTKYLQMLTAAFRWMGEYRDILDPKDNEKPFLQLLPL